MVTKRTLLAVAALVWMAAGFNVLRLGLLEYAANFSFLVVVLTIVIFVLFGWLFQKMAAKNGKRILAFEAARVLVFKFFTVRSYIIIALMMTFGIVLRNIPAVPRMFIAFFYVGLDAALFLAGVRFAVNYFRYAKISEESQAGK